MKYYLVAGEASGDLHASHLIAALKAEDQQASFRGFGGDLMAAQGMTLVRHYRELAFMGLVAVVANARTILAGMRQCREDIREWNPDVVILVDYPGFNLKIAKFVHSTGICPVYYYIAPKLWAWKEWRIKALRRDVDEVFSILPFEVDFFEGKHHLPIHYVGNPTVDEIADFSTTHSVGDASAGGGACADAGESATQAVVGVRCIAFLCGSRRHEVRDNLWRMLVAAAPFREQYDFVIAGVPTIEKEYYEKYIAAAEHRVGQTLRVSIEYNNTYNLLQRASAALVTSGTATLETALFGVPQVVCYFMQFRQIASFLRRLLIKVPYISLVNLIAGREVVAELVCEQMSPERCRKELEPLLDARSERLADMLAGYHEVKDRLGPAGAPQHAAKLMAQLLGVKNRTLVQND